MLYLRAPASLVTCEGTALLDSPERVVFLDSSERVVFIDSSERVVFLDSSERAIFLDSPERVVFLDSSERLVFLPKLVQGELEDSSVDLLDILLFWLLFGVYVVDVMLITIDSAVRAANSCEYLDKTPVGCVKHPEVFILIFLKPTVFLHFPPIRNQVIEDITGR